MSTIKRYEWRGYGEERGGVAVEYAWARNIVEFTQPQSRPFIVCEQARDELQQLPHHIYADSPAHLAECLRLPEWVAGYLYEESEGPRDEHGAHPGWVRPSTCDCWHHVAVSVEPGGTVVWVDGSSVDYEYHGSGANPSSPETMHEIFRSIDWEGDSSFTVDDVGKERERLRRASDEYAAIPSAPGASGYESAKERLGELRRSQDEGTGWTQGSFSAAFSQPYDGGPLISEMWTNWKTRETEKVVLPARLYYDIPEPSDETCAAPGCSTRPTRSRRHCIQHVPVRECDDGLLRLKGLLDPARGFRPYSPEDGDKQQAIERVNEYVNAGRVMVPSGEFSLSMELGGHDSEPPTETKTTTITAEEAEEAFRKPPLPLAVDYQWDVIEMPSKPPTCSDCGEPTTGAKTCAFCLDLRAKSEIIKARRGE